MSACFKTLCAAALLCAAVVLHAEEPAPAESASAEEARQAAVPVKLQLTLEDAKQIALKNNPTLAVARANILAARAAVKSARGAYYPTLDISAGYTRIEDYAQGRPNSDYPSHDRYDLGLSAGWLLYNGGARRFNELIAIEGGRTAINECQDAKRILLDQVAAAFYLVIRSQNSMDISKQDADFNRQLENDARERNRLGTAKASEVLNFEYQVANAEANYISAESYWRTACVILGKLLVLDQADIWENLELACPDDSIFADFQCDIPALIEYAGQHRPDVRKARSQLKTADYGIKVAQADWQPNLSAFLDYGFVRDSNFHFNSHSDRNFSFGLKASWNIFKGFATDAAIARAKASRKMAWSTLSNTMLELEAEIRQAVINFESSKKTLAQQTKLHKIAQDIRDLVHEEYLGGTATITRLNEAQTNLTNAALSLSNAHVQVLTSLETLNAATAKNLEGMGGRRKNAEAGK